MDAKSLIELKPNRNIRDFRPGDTVRVHAKVVEGDRERIQIFEGVVLRIRRRGPASSFTVRRISHGVGVERIFPFHSPLIEKVEVSKVGKVRRAKLYYLRGRTGKAARVRPGSRARFEELTAPLTPEPEEEEIVVGEEGEVEEGAEETAVEATEAAGDEPTSEDAEAATEEPAAQEEPATEEAPDTAEEPAAEADAAAEETSEEAAPEPEAEEEKEADEPASESEAEAADDQPEDAQTEEAKE